jgi:hypothetical protein
MCHAIFKHVRIMKSFSKDNGLSKITLSQKNYLKNFAVFLLSFPTGALVSYLYSCALNKCDSFQVCYIVWYLMLAAIGLVIFLKVDNVITHEEEVYQMHLEREKAAHREAIAVSEAITKAIEEGDLSRVKELDDLR